MWSTSATTYPWLARSSARLVSSVRGMVNPGESITSGKRPCSGRASERAQVRVPLTASAGMVVPGSFNWSMSWAASTVMYGAGPPVPGRAG